MAFMSYKVYAFDYNTAIAKKQYPFSRDSHGFCGAISILNEIFVCFFLNTRIPAYPVRRARHFLPAQRKDGTPIGLPVLA